MRIDLPDGDWADVRELDELRDGDRKALNKAVSLTLTSDEGDNTGHLPGSYEDDMMDALLARVVTNWSLRMPLPSRLRKVLDDLTLGQAKALRDGVKPHYDLLMERVDPNAHGTDPTSGSAS